MKDQPEIEELYPIEEIVFVPEIVEPDETTYSIEEEIVVLQVEEIVPETFVIEQSYEEIIECDFDGNPLPPSAAKDKT